jgi:hypothetical protein
MEMLLTATIPKDGEELLTEIAEVRQQLLNALADLSSPLGELVRSQLEHSVADWRIGLLLVAARGTEVSERTRQQRLLLSAAIEMLYLALSIHKLLLVYVQNRSNPIPERAWTGSVILAGDYCFSRSAVLAAQTNLPRVVDIFAQALKTVSEEILRHLLPAAEGTEPELFAEGYELVSAGLQAAAVIADLDEKTTLATVEFGQMVSKQLAVSSFSPAQWPTLPITLAPWQRPYWQILLIRSDTNKAI